MLIKTFKILAFIAFKMADWTMLPLFGFLFRHSQWKDRPFDLARAILNDPQIVKAATDTGGAMMLVQLRDKMEMMAHAPKAPTQEDMRAAVEAEQRYPVSQDACNEYLRVAHRRAHREGVHDGDNRRGRD